MESSQHCIILSVQPTLMLLTDRGVFLERTRAECRNKLYLYCRHEFVMFEVLNMDRMQKHLSDHTGLMGN
jgi:hypothetical protein